MIGWTGHEARTVQHAATPAGAADRRLWRIAREIHVADTGAQARAEARDGAMARAFGEYMLPLVSANRGPAVGSSRGSRQDFARFVEIATGSVFEVVSHSTVAKRQGWLSEADYVRVYEAAAEQSRMLSGLKKSLVR